MSADFWAGYISGAIGILIGNPLDIVKVRLQAQSRSLPQGGLLLPPFPSAYNHAPGPLARAAALATGTAAPILGYGALNALLFVSYNRAEAALNRAFSVPTTAANLWTTWLAGAVGGLATWVVSTPTEVIKCRAQLSNPPRSSWSVSGELWRQERLRGFFLGGWVTAMRDSVGYGFYFWSYALTTQWVASLRDSAKTSPADASGGAIDVLLCGGIAGVVTWASIFPLDVIKTRLQAQPISVSGETTCLLPSENHTTARRAPTEPIPRLGSLDIAKQVYREGGIKLFFRGLTVCSIRAFIVNAVQWAVYEWVMRELRQGRGSRVAS